jgi:hypothetical protein
MPQLNPENYTRVSAIVIRETLKSSLEKSFPDHTTKEREAMLIDIVSRVSRMYGHEVRRVVFEEADGE